MKSLNSVLSWQPEKEVWREEETRLVVTWTMVVIGDYEEDDDDSIGNSIT